jgi:hypothetical protein
VQRCDPAPVTKVVKDGLSFAIKHATNPTGLIDSQAQSGPAAWEYWSNALASGEAKRDHHTYNVQLWLECREMAVVFVNELKTHLPDNCAALLDKAAAEYNNVREKLSALLELHPPREKTNWEPDSTFTSPEAAQIVREAGGADARGLSILSEIVNVIAE